MYYMGLHVGVNWRIRRICAAAAMRPVANIIVAICYFVVPHKTYSGSIVPASSFSHSLQTLLPAVHSRPMPKRHKTVVCPSVRLSRRSTAAAVAGGFATKVGRGQQMSTDSRCCRIGAAQSCPWVGLTHRLGWVEFFQFLVGWVHYSKRTKNLKGLR